MNKKYIVTRELLEKLWWRLSCEGKSELCPCGLDEDYKCELRPRPRVCFDCWIKSNELVEEIDE